MKKENLRIFLLGLTTFIGFNMLVQTAYAEITNKAILGKWVTIGSTDTVEFFEDGTIIFEAKMEGEDTTIIGDYRFLNQNRIRIDFHGIFEMGGPQVTRISIDNDKLILNKLLDERIELKKMTKAMQIYLDGLALYEKEKFNEAANLFEKAAKLGELEAQNRLGFMFYNGTGVEKNYQKAFKWSLEAAKQGVAPAQRLLGFMYHKGNGTKKNIEKSILWAKKAADQGDVYAQNILAWIYATSKNPGYRNGELAVKYAMMAHSQKRDKWYINSSLAAAYARDGQFEEAAITHKKAINLLRWDAEMPSDEKQRQLNESEVLLNLYQSGKAYDEGFDIGAEVKAQKERVKQDNKRFALLAENSKKQTKILKEFLFSMGFQSVAFKGKITNSSIIYAQNTTSSLDQFKWPNNNAYDIWFGSIRNIKKFNDFLGSKPVYTLWIDAEQQHRLKCRDKEEIDQLYSSLIPTISKWYDKYGEVMVRAGKKKPAFLTP